MINKPAPRTLLVTSALPYANGDLHLGHVLEVTQTDIWCRFQKTQGHRVHYVCGEDCHGASVMIRAEKEGITPEALSEKMQHQHQRDIQGFLVDQDIFYSTHSPENKHFSTAIFKTLEDQGAIIQQTKQQLFDPERKMFLADRFVKGTCPKCKTPDQYGDNCEACGATYEPKDLIDPASTFSGATPTLEAVEQLYFDLPQFKVFLDEWLAAGHLQPAVANKLSEWVEGGLMPWDISRQAPYFGFEIPGHQDKYFYVWLDACLLYTSPSPRD